MAASSASGPRADDHSSTKRRRGPRGAPGGFLSPPPVSPLYKTRKCNYFEAGKCKAGSLCPFAHGEVDLRPSPDFERTSVCPTFRKNGVCRVEGCRYAHSSADLKASPVMLKTKLCAFFFAKGGCIIGEACRFAHSKDELQEADAVRMAAAVPKEPPMPAKMSRRKFMQTWGAASAPPAQASEVEAGAAAAASAAELSPSVASPSSPGQAPRESEPAPETHVPDVEIAVELAATMAPLPQLLTRLLLADAPAAPTEVESSSGGPKAFEPLLPKPWDASPALLSEVLAAIQETPGAASAQPASASTAPAGAQPDVPAQVTAQSRSLPDRGMEVAGEVEADEEVKRGKAKRGRRRGRGGGGTGSKVQGGPSQPVAEQTIDEYSRLQLQGAVRPDQLPPEWREALLRFWVGSLPPHLELDEVLLALSAAKEQRGSTVDSAESSNVDGHRLQLGPQRGSHDLPMDASSSSMMGEVVRLSMEDAPVAFPILEQATVEGNRLQVRQRQGSSGSDDSPLSSQSSPTIELVFRQSTEDPPVAFPTLEQATELGATAQAGRVIVASPSQAAADCHDRVVEYEHISWKARCARNIGGIGGALLAIAESPAISSAALFTGRPRTSSKTVKVMIDIEDLGDASLREGLAPCFAKSDATGRGNGSCTKGSPFPECALCVKNTFLTFTYEGDEERPRHRRTKSF